MIVEHIGGANAKIEKILKKAEGFVLIVYKAGKDYGKKAVEAKMAKINVNIDGKTKKAIFIFAECPCEMEDFLRVNPCLSR